MTDSPRSPLVDLLDLEQIDRDLYRGRNEVPDNARPNIYGGQVAAQALMAAGLTVAEDRYPHSLHGYFLRRGKRDQPVVYAVDRDRDGRSFSARRVSALQHGEVIFDLAASFHVDEPGGDHVIDMPTGLPDPDECEPDSFGHNFPSGDARLIPPTRVGVFGTEISSRLWVRVVGRLPEDRLVHACALAYLSDISSGFATLDVDELPRGGPSLDHAMWFRAPIRADEWTLLDMWPLMAGGARGLYAGSMHAHDGTLAAMLTQEALLRPLRD